MLAGGSGGEDLPAMQRVRCRRHDGADSRIGQSRRELSGEGEIMPFGKVPVPVGVADDGAREAQPTAPARNRCDEGAAPAAEADDRGVDHRPVRLADPPLAPHPSPLLASGEKEGPAIAGG
jgi:hypothetical protein